MTGAVPPHAPPPAAAPHYAPPPGAAHHYAPPPGAAYHGAPAGSPYAAHGTAVGGLDPRLIAFAGAALLAIGCFLPLFELPYVGSINYFSGSDGKILLALAAAGAALAFLGKTKFVAIPGLLALALMAVTYFTFESRMGELRSTLQNNPYGQTVASSTGMGWAWFILIPGALALIYAGIVAWRSAAAAPRGPTY